MTVDHRDGWSLLFLATIILGSDLNDGSSIQATSDSNQALDRRPVLQPTEAVPITGTYSLKTPAGQLCLKATMGIEYIVIVKKKPWYFNLDPTRVITSGYCVNDTAFLSLNLPFNAASLQFIFKKEANASYVSKVTALIFPLPVCNGCTSKMYPGVLANDKLFRVPYGRSFKCDSQSVFVMAEDLRIKLVPLQIQAFTVPEGQYGPEVECWADFERRVIPIIMGATAVGLILITVLSYLIHRDRHRPGYERI